MTQSPTEIANKALQYICQLIPCQWVMQNLVIGSTGFIGRELASHPIANNQLTLEVPRQVGENDYSYLIASGTPIKYN